MLIAKGLHFPPKANKEALRRLLKPDHNPIKDDKFDYKSATIKKLQDWLRNHSISFSANEKKAELQEKVEEAKKLADEKGNGDAGEGSSGGVS